MLIEFDLRSSAKSPFEGFRPAILLESQGRKKSCLLLIIMALCPLLLCGHDGLMDEPFALRFPAAFSHFSPFADVAAKGGASAASPFGSSSNLAGIAWSFQPQQFDYLASANYDFLTFDGGTEMHLSTQTLAFDVADVGIFRVAVIEFQSNSHLTRMAPVSYEFDLIGTRLDWSKRFEKYGIGAGMGFTRADTLFSTPRLRLSDSEKDNFTFRLSGQRQLGKRWLLGAVADYGSGSTDLVREVAPGVRNSFQESSDQWIIQTGLAFLISPKAAAHLDYQYSQFANADEGLTLHRWSAGTDIPLCSWFMLRAGASTDHLGNFGWSSGFVIFPRVGASINLAYQNGMFPELDREFGNAQMFNLSISVKW